MLLLIAVCLSYGTLRLKHCLLLKLLRRRPDGISGITISRSQKSWATQMKSLCEYLFDDFPSAFDHFLFRNRLSQIITGFRLYDGKPT